MSKRVYLASQSPRRLELLRQIGIDATVLPLRHQPPRADVDETPLPGEAPEAHVVRVAGLKARAGLKAMFGRRLPRLPIVAADTTVVIDGEILGKPADAAAAKAMLARFSGREHEVLSGVAVAWDDQVHTRLSRSVVRFRVLTQEEIAAYVASREPLDKAGAYGIQGRAALFVEHLAGSYSGVMGLPLFETGQLLQLAGLKVV